MCSSISCDSGSLSDDEFGQMNRKTVGTRGSYPFSPAKSSRMNLPTRSRPGIQRSDHTSASVQQLEFDDSCASFYSSASTATTSSTTMSKQFRSLSRKESISPTKRSMHGSCLDLSKSFSIGCDAASTNTSPTRSSSSNYSRKKVVQFAPLSENLYVPTPSLDEMTPEEIMSTWFASQDYDEQRLSNQKTVVMMEQELQQAAGEVTVTAFTSVIKAIEGSRGLEHRTKEGIRSIFRNRQQSIQAVLMEQEKQKKDPMIRSDQHVIWQQSAAIASAYSMETIMSILDAVERAMYDAKEADVVISDPTLFEIISPKSRYKRSTSSSVSLDQRFASELHNADGPPSNVARKPIDPPFTSSKYNNDSISDSLHTLSSPTKRGYKPRPLPKRLSSSSSSTMIPLALRRNASNRNISFLTSAAAPPLHPVQTRGDHSLTGTNAASLHMPSGPMLAMDAASTLRHSNHRGANMKESLLSLGSKSSHSKTAIPIRQNSNESKGSKSSKSYSSRQIVV
jgi:hypothetical protein